MFSTCMKLHSIKPSLLLYASALMLGACSYFDAPEPSGNVVDLISDDSSFQVVEEPQPVDFMDLANSVSDSSVRVYSLDVPYNENITAPISAGSGRVNLSNPSVEIIPLDENMQVPPANRPAVAASIVPVEVENTAE